MRDFYVFPDSEESLVPDSKMLLNKLFEHAPGAVNVRDLKVDAMFVYGKVVSLSGICCSSVSETASPLRRWQIQLSFVLQLVKSVACA